MAAPRSTSLRALRAITQANQPQVHTTRGLHITGAASAPYGNQGAFSPASAELYHSRSIKDLRAECKRRSITTSGSHGELMDRLSGHDALQQRAYSIAMKRVGTSSGLTQYAVADDSTAGPRNANSSS